MSKRALFLRVGEEFEVPLDIAAGVELPPDDGWGDAEGRAEVVAIDKRNCVLTLRYATPAHLLPATERETKE